MLKAKYRLPILNKLLIRANTKHLPSLQKSSSIILASSELASLFHFPSSYHSKNQQSDNFAKSHAVRADLIQTIRKFRCDYW